LSSSALTDEAVFSAFPGVLIDRDNIAHYRGLMSSELLINHCDDCGYWVYPHRPLCPQCLSWEVQPTMVSGKGRVFMFTLIHQERDPNNRLREPLIAAAVELEEQKGLRYLTRIVNCSADAVRHDMPVQLTWLAREGQVSLPVFEPVTQGEG
jgi:uncharacterized protein